MRLLVLTHTFPPSYISNAKRPFYLVRGFLEAGWSVDVFTSDFGMKPGEPETVQHPGLRIFRTGDPMIRLVGQALERHGLFRAGSLAASAVLWPDPYVVWAIKTLRACRRMGATSGRDGSPSRPLSYESGRLGEAPLPGQYDRALIFVLPASLLLSGLVLRLVGPHCVFDYQESVTPYFRRHRRRSPLQRLLVPLLAKLERHTLHKAGRVVFTADTNRRAYVDQGLAREDATAHVPYFFDAAAFREPGPVALASPGFQVVYFGTFDWRGERSPQTFLQSLARFLEQRPEARAHTRFQFYGNWLPEHNSLLEDLHLRDIARIQTSVPYEQYLQELKRSPILLLVVSSAHNLFMPSKIVDYFGAGRPILAFVPRESEMRRVLEAAGMANYASDEFDAAQGAAALEQLWQRYQAGGLPSQTDKTGFWSSETQIPRYLELLQNCTKAK